MSGSKYEVEVYWAETLTSKIFVDGLNVTFENYIPNTPGINACMLPFGVHDGATYEDLLGFYEDRCFPRDRADCSGLLKRLDIPCYDPELICRKLHGQQFDDFMWLQFSDEPRVTYEEIKLR